MINWQNIKFLARQGIALRGNGSGDDSNFLQLLQLWEQHDLRISGWMAKKTDKYTSPDIQNEIRSWNYSFAADCIRNS